MNELDPVPAPGKPSTQVPDQAELAQTATYLVAKGVPPAAVDAALGTSPAGRTRRQIEAGLTGWLKNRPKA